jgi:hypothetical protein
MKDMMSRVEGRDVVGADGPLLDLLPADPEGKTALPDDLYPRWKMRDKQDKQDT